MERTGCLIISDGGTTSLLACAAAADRSRGNAGSAGVAVWEAPGSVSAESDMRGAVQRQAELFGFMSVPGAELVGEGGRSPDAEAEVLSLYRAGVMAAKRKQARVVWPVSAGVELNLETTGRVIDRALLVSRLVALEAGAEAGPVIEAPYADLTDAQIADLILDMDLPVWTCWWFAGVSAEAVAERERWTVAMRKAGWKGPLPGPEVVTRGAVSDRPVSR